MSEIAGISAVSSSVGSLSAWTSVGQSLGTGRQVLSAGGSLPQSGETGSIITSTQQSWSLSSSSGAYATQGSATNDKLAALVLALIQILLGQKDKEDEDKKLLAGLVGMLALSAGSRYDLGQYRSIEMSQSSQVLEITTTSNAAAVQAGAYSRSVGSAGSSTSGTLGQSLNVSA